MENTDGDKLILKRMSDTEIIRHILIRGDANPYNPEYEHYFDQRMTKMWNRRERKGGLV